jgi:hypothetical protein
VVTPLLYQGVAGDPLARGEGQAGGTNNIVEIPPTDEEAVHGVLVSRIREWREGAGQTSGGIKDFHTGLSKQSTRQDDPCYGDYNQSIVTSLTYPL